MASGARGFSVSFEPSRYTFRTPGISLRNLTCAASLGIACICRELYVLCVAQGSTEFTRVCQRGNDVPVAITCVNCCEVFYRPPAFIRHGERRGSPVKFCSRACTDAARSAGTIGTKKRTGVHLKCEVCETDFYRPKSTIAAGRSRFCSEPCRQIAFQRKLIDRTGARPERLLGTEITCVVCANTRYRKRSMIDRNIDKTCGDPVCVGAYSRSLWGLPPRDPETARKPRGERKQRRTNFTAKQRREWLGTSCARCGTAENLTLDHVNPVCAGGQSVRENAQTLCGPCNNWKAKYVDKPLARRQALSGG